MNRRHKLQRYLGHLDRRVNQSVGDADGRVLTWLLERYRGAVLAIRRLLQDKE